MISLKQSPSNYATICLAIQLFTAFQVTNQKSIIDSGGCTGSETNVECRRITLDYFIRYINSTSASVKFITLTDCNIELIPSGAFNISELIDVRGLTITNSVVQTIEDYAFSYLQQLLTLKLQNNSIESISRNTFYGLNKLVELDLSENGIQSIEPKSFVHFKDSLNKLNMVDNNLHKLEVDMFQGLSSITELNLTNCDIELLQENCFNGLSIVNNLILNNNKIKTLAPSVFKSLPNLKHLSLKNNIIQTYFNTSFDGLTHLETIDLENNQISALYKSGFHFLEGIHSFNFKNNRIKMIEKGAFGGFHFNLSAVNFENNNLGSVRAKFMENSIGTPETLILKNCSISKIEPFAFEALDRLKHLDLSGNRIGTLEKNTFSGLVKLEQLDLNGLYIESINDFAFAGATKLKRLIVSNNRIKKLTSNVFSELATLQMLDLRNNSILKIENGAFKDLKLLETFLVDKIVFTQNFTKGFFTGLERIKRIDLSNINLRQLNEECFFGLDGLELLNLTGNEITTLKPKTFYGLISLTELDLSKNPLKTIEPNAFLDLSLLTNLILPAEFKISVVEQNTFSGLSNLKYFDLSSRNVSVVKSYAFSTLSNLKSLNLSQNKLTYINADTFPDCIRNLNLAYNNISDWGFNNITTKELSNLKYLNMSHNIIESLTDNFLTQLSNVETLDISSNKIKKLNIEVFTCYFDLNLKNINLNNNLFLCSRLDKILYHLYNLDINFNYTKSNIFCVRNSTVDKRESKLAKYEYHVDVCSNIEPPRTTDIPPPGPSSTTTLNPNDVQNEIRQLDETIEALKMKLNRVNVINIVMITVCICWLIYVAGTSLKKTGALGGMSRLFRRSDVELLDGNT